MPLDKTECSLGMRVQDPNGRAGIIRWMGRMEKPMKPPNGDVGTYIGVEFDSPLPAYHYRGNGTWAGQQLFSAPPGTVEFWKPKHFIREINAVCIKELRQHFGSQVDWILDYELVKFGIARKFEMTKVIEMLRDHLKWRAEFKPSESDAFDPQMAEDYPVGFGEGVDHEGNLLYFEQPGNRGKCHPQDFVKKWGLETIGRWHTASLETGRRLMIETNFRAQRISMVVDLTKLGDCGTALIDFAKTLSKIDQANYPEYLGKMFIINAPTFFANVWKLVRLFVDDRTKEKVHVLDCAHSREVLLNHIDLQFLPTFAGGSNDSWMKKKGRSGRVD